MPSGPRVFFRPLRLQDLAPSALAPWALMSPGPGPRAFMPSCLLHVLISCLSWSSLPHMLFDCLLYLLVLCILLSGRFCHLPSWALRPLPPHSVIMSLSDSAWSSPPFRSSSYQRGSAHSPEPLSLLISVPQALPSPAIYFSDSFL